MKFDKLVEAYLKVKNLNNTKGFDASNFIEDFVFKLNDLKIDEYPDDEESKELIEKIKELFYATAEEWQNMKKR